MARAPDFTGFLGSDYIIPKGDGGLRFAANVKYTTSYVVTDPRSGAANHAALRQNRVGAPPVNTSNCALAGTPYVSRASEQRARQSAFAQVNASVTWTDPTDHYYVRVWGNNLTDMKYRTHYNPLAPAPTCRSANRSLSAAPSATSSVSTGKCRARPRPRVPGFAL